MRMRVISAASGCPSCKIGINNSHLLLSCLGEEEPCDDNHHPYAVAQRDDVSNDKKGKEGSEDRYELLKIFALATRDALPNRRRAQKPRMRRRRPAELSRRSFGHYTSVIRPFNENRKIGRNRNGSDNVLDVDNGDRVI